MNLQKFLIIALFVGALFAGTAAAERLNCTFDNTIAHINCNLVGAKETFCTTAMGAIANNPAVATMCSSSTIVCSLDRTTNQTVRCSNTPSYVSGPTASAGVTTEIRPAGGNTCSYNDCELNQVACASSTSYRVCVGPGTDGCNTWQTDLCVGGGQCGSNSTADFERCMGIGPGQNKPGSVEQVGGVFFFRAGTTTTTPPASPPSTGTGSTTGGTASSSTGYNYNGKKYYVVKSDDPNKNTGNKVCASQGKTCVGYTAHTTAVCQQVHPNSKVVSNSVNGSKAGYYCNGSPQTGLACESTYDTCQVCPACNVNVDCATEIGTQFREMYVECGAPTNTPSDISGVGVIGDGRYNVEDLSTGKKYGVVVAQGTVSEWQEGEIANIDATLRVKPQAIAAVQASPTPIKEIKNQLNTGGIEYVPAGIVNQVKFFFFRLYLNFQ